MTKIERKRLEILRNKISSKRNEFFNLAMDLDRAGSMRECKVALSAKGTLGELLLDMDRILDGKAPHVN